MFERGVPVSTVEATVRSGEVIEAYPNDSPWPSWLLLGQHEGRALHVVVAADAATGVCVVVTVYWPGVKQWDASFTRRKQ